MMSVRIGSMVLAAMLLPAAFADGDDKGKQSVHAFEMKSIDGKPIKLATYKDHVLMIVNTASKWGMAPQYSSLESTFRKYKDQGFRVLSFPANNFGNQEPRTNEEIKSFCTGKYDATFDMFEKISVKGDDQCDLYKYLTAEDAGHEHGGEIPWNFTKFIIDGEGKVIGRFGPRTEPDDPEVIAVIEKALKAS